MDLEQQTDSVIVAIGVTGTAVHWTHHHQDLIAVMEDLEGLLSYGADEVGSTGVKHRCCSDIVLAAVGNRIHQDSVAEMGGSPAVAACVVDRHGSTGE